MVRADLIGKNGQRPIAKYKTTTLDSQIAHAIIQREFNFSVEKLFAEFSNAPIAAASIACP